MPQDDKTRLLLATVISIFILLVWQIFFVFPEQEASVIATPDQVESQTQKNNVIETEEASIPRGAGDEPLVATKDSSLIVGEGADKRIQIMSPNLLGSINLYGAKLDDLTLRNYNVKVQDNSKQVELLKPSGSVDGGAYFMQVGWLGRYEDGAKLEVPNYQTLWQISEGGGILSPDDSLTLYWENDDKIRFEIDFHLDENYMFTYVQRVKNSTGQAINVRPYGLISRAGTPVLENFYILHEGFIGYMAGEHQEIDYTDVSDAEEQRETYEGTGGWLGITDKYWLAALIPPQATEKITYNVQAAPVGNDFRYQADILFEGKRVAKDGTHEQEGRFFAGAKRVAILDSYEQEYQITSFDKAVDFGWLYFLTKPTFYLLEWIFEQIGNFGLAILVLTVLIKLLFFPLAQRSYRSISKMKLLQPKMETLREKYKDDRQNLSKAMMEMYRKEKVNPLAGCLPVLLQIPVFFALYKVLFVTIEMRHAPFFGWIEDLSVPDPLGLLTLFGLFEWNVPAFLQVVNIGIWPILMGATMWLQQKIQPTPPDPIQARIFSLLPFIFTFVLATFPAGLVIYWTWNNLLSICQQSLIMRSLSRPPPPKAKKDS